MDTPRLYHVCMEEDGLSPSKLGLSRDLANLTHLPSLIDPTSPAVRAKFVPPKPKFGGSDVGFPSQEFDQTDPTDPQDFRRYLVDLVRSRPFSSRSRRDFARSSQGLVENGLD